MKFLILESKNPYKNLAIEEYLFSNTKDDVFMLWQNEPTVVIGKNQNAFAEINMEYIKKNNIHIARRITGGGAVYHDLGNVNYTFISNKGEAAEIDFAYFTAPIIEALKTLGINAALSGRNDLMIGDKKFSGNAQHTKENRVLHHGTLLFDSELDILSYALKVDEEKIKAKAIKSARSRVTNLRHSLTVDITVEQFIQTVANFVIDKYNPEIITPPTNEAVVALENRNKSPEWIFPSRDFVSSYKLVKKKRYDFGIVEIYLDMSNELIRAVKIVGDFFEVGDIRELEEYLSATTIEELYNKLEKINIGDYIFGMTNKLFLEQLK